MADKGKSQKGKDSKKSKSEETPPEPMVKKERIPKQKDSKKEKLKAVVPEIVDPNKSVKISKKKSKTRKITDFEKYALVATNFPIDQDPFTMDGTRLNEISTMANDKYATELTRNVKRVFQFDKLEELNGNNLLRSGKRQIDAICNCKDSLNTHTNMFNIAFFLCIGKILNYIYDFFGNRTKYSAWLRVNFGSERMRYFQQARQLDRMGDFSRRYAPLGKTRLLELDRLGKPLLTDYYKSETGIFVVHPPEDITQDMDGLLLKEHVDGIITYYRFKNEGVDFIEFDQAKHIASFLHKSITKKRVTAVKKWLENQENEEEAFDDLVMNKMVFPYSESGEKMSGFSLNKLFAEIVNYGEKVDVNDEEWITNQKSEIDEESMIKAYNTIVELSEILDIDLAGPGTSNQNEAEVV